MVSTLRSQGSVCVGGHFGGGDMGHTCTTLLYCRQSWAVLTRMMGAENSLPEDPSQSGSGTVFSACYMSVSGLSALMRSA